MPLLSYPPASHPDAPDPLCRHILASSFGRSIEKVKAKCQPANDRQGVLDTGLFVDVIRDVSDGSKRNVCCVELVMMHCPKISTPLKHRVSVSELFLLSVLDPPIRPCKASVLPAFPFRSYLVYRYLHIGIVHQQNKNVDLVRLCDVVGRWSSCETLEAGQA